MSVVTPAMLAAAWDAWSPRRGQPDRKVGPGPAFNEAVTAAVDVGVRDGVLMSRESQVALLETVELYSMATAVAQDEARRLRLEVERLEKQVDELGMDLQDANDEIDMMS